MTLKQDLENFTTRVATDMKMLLGSSKSITRTRKPLLIYYGYPIAYKSMWEVSEVVAEISASYSYWVVGHTYQDPSHDEYASTVSIMQAVRAAGVKLYGYIPLGTSSYNYSLAQITTIVDQWKAIGVDGIFLDEYGYDYGVTRQRQIDVVNMVHSKGLPVCANAWVFEEFVSDTLAETGWSAGDWKYERWLINNPNNLPSPKQAGDSYLIENFCYDNLGPTIVWDTQERCANIRALATTKNVELWAVAVFGETTPGTVDSTKLGNLLTLDKVGEYISANAFLFDIQIVGSGGYSFGSNGTPVWAPLYSLPEQAIKPTQEASNDYTAKTSTRYFGQIRLQVTNTDTQQLVEITSTAPKVLGQNNNNESIPGPPGNSAYEIALSNGFIGTEAQWLTSLVGPTNPQGNLLLNPHLAINQRGVSGSIVRTAGVYGHDMWKGGSSGCTYSVSGSGLSAIVTVSAGTLQQVVEGLRLTSGPVCLSWVGTAQARINGGPWGDSGITATATADTHLTVEFGPGTFSCPKLESGAVATGFVVRDFAFDQMACMRYLQRVGAPSVAGMNFMSPCLLVGSATWLCSASFPVPMRSIPTFHIGAGGSVGDFSFYHPNGNYYSVNSFVLNPVTTPFFWMVTGVSPTSHNGNGFGGFVCAKNPANKFFLFSAEI